MTENQRNFARKIAEKILSEYSSQSESVEGKNKKKGISDAKDVYSSEGDYEMMIHEILANKDDDFRNDKLMDIYKDNERIRRKTWYDSVL